MAHRNLVVAALVAGAVVAWAATASAQSFVADAAEVRLNMPASLFTSTVTDTPPAPAPAATAATAAVAPGEFRRVRSSRMLSGSLIGLYASTAILQALDA